ncbi:MAG: reverse transcriptase family protein [Candidatus Aminicenantales bacterium]
MLNLENISVSSLCHILGLSDFELRKFIRAAPRLYYPKLIQQKNQKIRKLEIPHRRLKNYQTIILREVLSGLKDDSRIFGGPGTSTKDAMRLHTHKPVLITSDIKDFFPSIKAFHVRNAFRKHGASEEMADILTRLVTHHNRLPQGAPTSPAIGRLILQPIAEELDNILKNIRKFSLSIYVDDIILSGPIGIKGFLSTIRRMLLRHGFRLNEKTKIMYRNEEQVCLNIRVNDGIAPPTLYIEKVRELANIIPKSDPRLKGKMAYIEYLKKN